MQVTHNLDKDFEEKLNELKDTCGEELANINGLSNSKLNHTDFIDNFTKEESVADVSVDSSSNVSRHDMPTLMGEISKADKKLLSYNKIYYEIKKSFGKETADKWIQNDWDGHLYMHDAPTASLISYCVIPEECCSFVLDGKKVYASMSQIYDSVDEYENFDSGNCVFYKKPKNLYVLDYDRDNKCNRYTKVNLISKKARKNRLFFSKAANGMSLITTEDHKFITTSGEVEARNLNKYHQAITTFDDSAFTDSINEYYTLPLNWETGWLVGFYLAEGCVDKKRDTLCITQSVVNTKELKRLAYILKKYQIPSRVYYEDNEGISKPKYIIHIKSDGYMMVDSILKIAEGNTASTKRLCKDFVSFNNDFLKGFLSGLVDGDGTVSEEKKLSVRLTSRTLINQVRLIGLHFGVYFTDKTPYIQNQKNNKIKQKLPMYSDNYHMGRNKNFFLSLPSIKIQDRFTNFSVRESASNKTYSEGLGAKQFVKAKETYNVSDVVFDLSTESHTFVCNGILIHNCFAYDLKSLAERGLFFLEDNGKFNAEPPKHLETFVDFVKEFVHYTCNRTSGAVGLPNLIPYMFYFWKKDVDNGYYLQSPEYYAKQEIQRLIYGLNQPYTRDREEAVA